MRSPGTIALILLCFFASFINCNVNLEQVCNGIKGIGTCKATFEYPTGAKVKMCKKRWFQVDKCKTKQTYKYPCPTWRKPFRQCDGWTCVPGTRELMVDAPCGITFITKKMDLCDTVRGVMGNVGKQFLQKTAAMCSCIPEALKLITNGVFDAVKEGNGFSGAVSALLRDIIRVQKCLIDNGFSVKENKNEVIASQLTSKEGYTVLKAAEIDLVMYGELAGALATCLAGCDVDLIARVFTGYLTRSKDMMVDQVTAFLYVWTNLFNSMQENLKMVGSASRALVTGLESVPDKVKAVERRICQKNACLGPVVSSFMQKVSEAIVVSREVKDVTSASEDLARDVPKLVNKVDITINAIEAIPDADSLVDLVKNFQNIEDIIKASNVVTELPKLAQSIQQDGQTLVKFVTKYTSKGERALQLAQEIVSTAWESYPLEFTTDSSGNVRAGLVEIQKIIRESVMGPLSNVTLAVKALDNQIDRLPIRKGRLDLSTGVASYQRWSDVSMGVPCSRKASKEWTVAGIKGSFDYPEFYSCRYTQVIPWPNHHIPWIKFKVA